VIGAQIMRLLTQETGVTVGQHPTFNFGLRKGKMMFHLAIETENACFEGRELLEISLMLQGIAQRIEQGEKIGYVKDANGNKVGKFIFESY